MKRRIVCLLTLAFLCLTATAAAEPIQEFNVQIKDIKPDGATRSSSRRTLRHDRCAAAARHGQHLPLREASASARSS